MDRTCFGRLADFACGVFFIIMPACSNSYLYCRTYHYTLPSCPLFPLKAVCCSVLWPCVPNNQVTSSLSPLFFPLWWSCCVWYSLIFPNRKFCGCGCSWWCAIDLPWPQPYALLALKCIYYYYCDSTCMFCVLFPLPSGEPCMARTCIRGGHWYSKFSMSSIPTCLLMCDIYDMMTFYYKHLFCVVLFA